MRAKIVVVNPERSAGWHFIGWTIDGDTEFDGVTLMKRLPRTEDLDDRDFAGRIRRRWSFGQFDLSMECRVVAGLAIL